MSSRISADRYATTRGDLQRPFAFNTQSGLRVFDTPIQSPFNNMPSFRKDDTYLGSPPLDSQPARGIGNYRTSTFFVAIFFFFWSAPLCLVALFWLFLLVQARRLKIDGIGYGGSASFFGHFLLACLRPNRPSWEGANEGSAPPAPPNIPFRKFARFASTSTRCPRDRSIFSSDDSASLDKKTPLRHL